MQFNERITRVTESEGQEDVLNAPSLQSEPSQTGDLAQILQQTNIQQLNITINQTTSGGGTYKERVPVGTVYTSETAVMKILVGLLNDMQETTNDPLEFEQARGVFLWKLRELQEAKYHRETCFSDLLVMLDVAIAYSEPAALTEKAFNCIRESIYALALEVNQDDLKRFRKHCREANIDILKPLKPRNDLPDALEDLLE